MQSSEDTDGDSEEEGSHDDADEEANDELTGNPVKGVRQLKRCGWMFLPLSVPIEICEEWVCHKRYSFTHMLSHCLYLVPTTHPVHEGELGLRSLLIRIARIFITRASVSPAPGRAKGCEGFTVCKGTWTVAWQLGCDNAHFLARCSCPGLQVFCLIVPCLNCKVERPSSPFYQSSSLRTIIESRMSQCKENESYISPHMPRPSCVLLDIVPPILYCWPQVVV